MFRSGSRFIALSLPAALALAACVPVPPAQTPEEAAAAARAKQAAVARAAPIEAATTAYVSRADGPYVIPAVPLEKLREDMRRQEVAYASDMPAGSIIVHPGQKHLYLVTSPGKAIRYGISVGRAGFEWAGEAVVSETKQWPTWTPPKEMIERDPKLAKWEKGQPGGPTNPLGARAIYLLTNGRDYGYRIHGTPDWWSIGKNASSGCIRMSQQDVIDLNQRVQPGARVLVLNADGSVPKGLKLPPPAPVKKKPAPAKPAATPAVTPVSATPAPAAVTPAVSTPAVTPAAGTTTPVAPGSISPTPAAPVVTAPAITAPAVSAPAVTAPVVPAPAVTAPTAPVPASVVPATTAPVAPLVPPAVKATP